MFTRSRVGLGIRPSIGMALCTTALLTGTACAPSPSTDNGPEAQANGGRPNILMVLLDDLGYSDLGTYGGPVSTPTIDGLADEGAQFTNFHTNPVCAPTRASLMTGQDPHRVGLGSMEGLIAPGITPDTPGYKGSLEGTYTGIAELLSRTGYSTYQSGKWHLGLGPQQTPQVLGFDQNFTLYQGGGSHYSDALRTVPGRQEPVDTLSYERNGEPVPELPADFYSTDAYTDEMLDMIESGEDDDRPFFGYLAYTAPHDPLHVPDTELIEKYLNANSGDQDFTELRADRISEMASRGLIDANVDTRWPAQTPDWNTLTGEQKRDLAYRSAVYAAMIEHVDTQLGRIVDHLKNTGQFDNTVVVVASDNGAAGLSPDLYTQQPGAREWLEEHYPLIGNTDSYGAPGSFPVLSLANAQVSSGPFFHTKSTVFEGGTRSPLIVRTPNAGDRNGPRIVDTLAHISDLYPTFADYAGAALVDAEVLAGDSAKPLLDGSADDIGDNLLGLEMFGERAFRDGNSKLVFASPGNGGTGQYALYDLAVDPGETTDLATGNPEEVRRLSELWNRYALENNVIPSDFAAVNAAGDKAAQVIYTMDWAN
ncbi:arylsulfatase [Rhodococcus sp. IEGM 1354]|uniref:arylsulfatase n=1 Tax=Rhodococcus sp. IEGM 1354 TaxID=3047088 RepID=UPI0024B72AC4|nr:arylsulfatase [Rhodococcus sp. IEGM 1354]MDI9933227.1 arylsulfatase [Rhodococcus sp. IEGM 1354]